MDIIKTQNAVSSYFNNSLRQSLKYPETYTVSFDYNASRLTLIPSSRNAELINQIKVLSGLKNKIELTLLQAFQNKNPDITNVNFYIIDNNIVLTMTQSDKLFALPEEVILAKLASEYDISELGDVCRINSNFAKACRSDIFWWEIIRLKFPQYYKEKRNYNYDPRELIKGLDYFKKISETSSNIIYPDTIIKRIDKLYLDYYQTFKYLLLENIWIEYNIKNVIIGTIVEIGKSINFDSDLEILKTFLKNESLNEHIILKMDGMYITVYGLKLADVLDKWLFSEGKDQILKNVDFEEILDMDIQDNHGSNNPEYYEYLSFKLNHPETDERYLLDYSLSDMDHDKLQDYMLSKTSHKVDKDLLIQTGIAILNRGDQPTFERFYKYFIRRWTNDDINTFKSVVDRVFGHDHETIKEFNTLLEV